MHPGALAANTFNSYGMRGSIVGVVVACNKRNQQSLSKERDLAMLEELAPAITIRHNHLQGPSLWTAMLIRATLARWLEHCGLTINSAIWRSSAGA